MFFRFTLFALLFVLLVACASPSSPSSSGSPATNEIFSPRVYHQALNYDDKIWVIGGIIIKDATSVLLNDVWFSDDGRAWQQATFNASWQTRFGFGATIFDGKMWVVGGVGNDAVFNDVWNSTNGRDWELVTSSADWSPRVGIDPFVFDDKMWVVGGVVGNNNKIWSSVNGIDWLPSGTNSLSAYDAVVFENKIWIFEQGVSSDQDFYVWYSSDAVNYTKSHLNNFANFTALEFQNKIWLLGGHTTPEYNYNTELINFDPDNTSDTQTYTPNWHQRYGQASVVFDNKIWLLGGGYYSGKIGDNFSLELLTLFNDIWSWDNSQSDWTQER